MWANESLQRLPSSVQRLLRGNRRDALQAPGTASETCWTPSCGRGGSPTRCESLKLSCRLWIYNSTSQFLAATWNPEWYAEVPLVVCCRQACLRGSLRPRSASALRAHLARVCQLVRVFSCSVWLLWAKSARSLHGTIPQPPPRKKTLKMCHGRKPAAGQLHRHVGPKALPQTRFKKQAANDLDLPVRTRGSR